MPLYIWQRPDWPLFRWNAEQVLPLAAEGRFQHGQFLGTMAAAGPDVRQEAELSATIHDTVASNAIEGEDLPPASVRSSIARRLGFPSGTVASVDQRVERITEMMLDASQNYQQALTVERIFGWHRLLFEGMKGGRDPVEVGRLRNDALGAMQVVSTAHRGGKLPRVHFEAPPANRLAAEMAKFLAWFNADAPGTDGLIRAGIAHLWFVTIHPFDDGNGRLGRAIADLAIAQAEAIGRRFYSLSGAILKQRRGYYDALERAQKDNLDITDWLMWFLRCHSLAITDAKTTAARVIDIARFWAEANAADPPINARQRKVLGKLVEGWEGLMTTRKWVAICGTSSDTAQRDIADLVARGWLRPNHKGGRSTGYILSGNVIAGEWPQPVVT